MGESEIVAGWWRVRRHIVRQQYAIRIQALNDRSRGHGEVIDLESIQVEQLSLEG
jgi:hypothetical protein